MIVDKPKRGDIMCIDLDPEVMRVKKVVWIDGLSINLKQLPAAYEAIGICLSVKGNKAMVRYREERDMRWLAADYWVLQSGISQGEKTLKVTIDGTQSLIPLKLTSNDTSSLAKFVPALNNWFKKNNPDYSAKLAIKSLLM